MSNQPRDPDGRFSPGQGLPRPRREVVDDDMSWMESMACDV